MVEQDHRGIKNITKYTLGFKSFSRINDGCYQPPFLYGLDRIVKRIIVFFLH